MRQHPGTEADLVRVLEKQRHDLRGLARCDNNPGTGGQLREYEYEHEYEYDLRALDGYSRVWAFSQRVVLSSPHASVVSAELQFGSSNAPPPGSSM